MKENPIKAKTNNDSKDITVADVIVVPETPAEKAKSIVKGELSLFDNMSFVDEDAWEEQMKEEAMNSLAENAMREYYAPDPEPIGFPY